MSSDGAAADPAVSDLLGTLRSSLLLWRLKRLVKEEIIKPKYAAADVIASMPDIMAQLGATAALRNEVARLVEEGVQLPRPGELQPAAGAAGGAPILTGTHRPQLQPWPRGLPQHPTSEPLDAVREAMEAWEHSICEELNSMATEQRRPLVRARPPGETIPVRADQSVRFLFDAEDLLEAVVQMRSPNHSAHLTHLRSAGIVQLQLRTPTVEQLRAMMPELAPAQPQVGIDDVVADRAAFVSGAVRTARALLADGDVAALRRFARTGVPNELRGEVWAAALHATVGEKEVAYFARLMEQVRAGTAPTSQRRSAHRASPARQAQRWDMVTDSLLLLDVQHTIGSDAFFPFSDTLSAALTALSHDTWLLRHAAAAPASGRAAVLGAAASNGSVVSAFPPCGVVPYRGMSTYAAPLCYLLRAQAQLYFVFRAMYARYWCRVSCLRSQPLMAPSLCCCFERLLLHACPEVRAACAAWPPCADGQRCAGGGAAGAPPQSARHAPAAHCLPLDARRVRRVFGGRSGVRLRPDHTPRLRPLCLACAALTRQLRAVLGCMLTALSTHAPALRAPRRCCCCGIASLATTLSGCCP